MTLASFRQMPNTQSTPLALSRHFYSQRGLTMVELLVALVVSLLISLAAIAALVVTRQGFTAVDAASQLRDNGRFVHDLIQRLGVQSGFKDVLYAAAPPPPSVSGLASNPPPNVSGFNDGEASASDPLNVFTARAAADFSHSDILILRYQPAETVPGSGVTDRSMIDCSGNSTAIPSTDRYDRMWSVIHVADSLGEPSLMCSRVSAAGVITTEPIIKDVENFQVLYGFDAAGDSVPETYRRADELIVANPVTTNANWRRVRSIRVGMVIRGPVNSAQDKTAQTFYPFGPAKNSSTGAVGSALSSALDRGTVFLPGADGRLRQVVTFTVHLRNEQGL